MSKDIVVHNIPPSPCQDIQPTDTLKPYAREKLFCDNEHKKKNVELTRCGYIWHYGKVKNIVVKPQQPPQ
jgi:hypothetical protein